MNFNATSNHELVDINSSNVSVPPLQKLLSDEKIEKVRRAPLKFQHLCHNHSFKKYIKLASESSLSVCGFQKRDGIIWQKLRSRKLMKGNDAKNNSTVAL